MSEAERLSVPPKREDLKPGEVLCDHCTAKCCRYFALPMETPEEFADYEYLRWFLLHERVGLHRRRRLVPAGAHRMSASTARSSLRHLCHSAPDLPRVLDG